MKRHELTPSLQEAYDIAIAMIPKHGPTYCRPCSNSGANPNCPRCKVSAHDEDMADVVAKVFMLGYARPNDPKLASSDLPMEWTIRENEKKPGSNAFYEVPWRMLREAGYLSLKCVTQMRLAEQPRGRAACPRRYAVMHFPDRWVDNPGGDGAPTLTRGEDFIKGIGGLNPRVENLRFKATGGVVPTLTGGNAADTPPVAVPAEDLNDAFAKMREALEGEVEVGEVEVGSTPAAKAPSKSAPVEVEEVEVVEV